MEQNNIFDSSHRKWGKWFWVWLVVAFFMPFPSGLLLGITGWFDKDYRDEGRVVAVLSFIWWIVLMYFYFKLKIIVPSPRHPLTY